MIQIKSNEEKTLLFDVMVEGIDSKLLSFKFRLNVNGVEYGFPSVIEDEKIKVSIPILENILPEGTSGIFRGKLEGIGDGKYFLSPWEDSVEIKIEPKVIAKPEPIFEEKITNVKVKAYLTDSIVIPIEEEIKPVKKTGKQNTSLRNKLK